MRRFEHPSGKFWAIAELPLALNVMWGPIGERGQVRRIELPNFKERRARMRELIAKQLELGYVEVVSVTALVATIREDKRWYQLFVGERDHTVAIVVDGRRCYEWRDGARDPIEHRGPDHAAAVANASTLIATALAEGMRLSDMPEAGADDDPVLGLKVATNPELEAQCRASPDDAAPWSVYADWLMTEGDPRGEIAALRMTGEEGAADATFARSTAQLFGHTDEEEDDQSFAEAVHVTSWHFGFPRGATIKLDLDDRITMAYVAERFLALPLAIFVEELRFGLSGYDNDWGPTIAAVAASPRASAMRVLRFDDFTYEDREISWVSVGDFSHAWARLPALEELRIRGSGGTLGTIVAPRLTKFVRISGGLLASEIASIVDATWPELEFLELWFGQHQHRAEGNAIMLAPIFAARGLAKLRHLGIVNCEFSETAIQGLLAGALLRQLTSLDLSNGIIAHREVALLMANADKLRHLTAIDVSSNFIDAAQLRALQTALPSVTSTEQREFEDDEDEDDVDNRYAVLGE